MAFSNSSKKTQKTGATGQGIDFTVGDQGIAGPSVEKLRASKPVGTPPPPSRQAGMKGATRAAKLLLALGPDQAASVLKEMDISDIERLVNEMAQIKTLSPQEKKEVLADFGSNVHDFEAPLQGGMDAAREFLTRGLGNDRAQEILSRLERQDLGEDFAFLEQLDPQILSSALATEHPQVAAVALSYLKPRNAALVLKYFDDEYRTQVALRIARTSRTHPDAVQRVAKVLREKFEKRDGEIFSETGGANVLANILNHMDRGTEDGIMGALDKEAPEVFDDVKGLLYTFEELLNLIPQEMRLLLSQLDDDFTLAAALRGAGEDLRRHFFNSLSQNRAADILEEMDLRGPLSLREINEARTFILNVARRLDDEGEIVIKKEKEEYI